MQCGKRRKKRKNINLKAVFIFENRLDLFVCFSFFCLFVWIFLLCFLKQVLHLVSVCRAERIGYVIMTHLPDVSVWIQLGWVKIIL